MHFLKRKFRITLVYVKNELYCHVFIMVYLQHVVRNRLGVENFFVQSCLGFNRVTN